MELLNINFLTLHISEDRYHHGEPLYLVFSASTDTQPDNQDYRPDGVEAVMPFLCLSAEDTFTPGTLF